VQTNDGKDGSYFDKDFYTGETGDKGGPRNVNHECYIEYASRLKEAVKDTDCKTLLDIGAGIGLRTTNYINNGFDAYPCDISEYAFENSVLKDKYYCCDVRNLDAIKNYFDIVNVERILGYLKPEDSLLALENIDRKAKRFIFFSIICLDHVDQINVVNIARPGRINLQLKSFWLELFSKFKNWKFDEEKTKIMLRNGWDCIWVFEKVPE